MGFRHAQAVISRKADDLLWIVEPDNEIFRNNLKLINASLSEVNYLKSLNDIPENIDLAIIATSAQPRFSIMKLLLNLGVKKFLLEKVVFQSLWQFDEIIELLENKGAVAYINFVNRYFSNYLFVKSSLIKNHPLSFIVSGGNFGIGCNALHYIDLFEFITGKKSSIVSSNLFLNSVENRRGASYKEFNGLIAFTTTNADRLVISAIPEMNSHEIIIIQDGNINILNEQTLKHSIFYNGALLETKKFDLLPTSKLTKSIIDDIESGNCFLPSIQETKNCHIQLFGAINGTLGLTQNDLCPIT